VGGLLIAVRYDHVKYRTRLTASFPAYLTYMETAKLLPQFGRFFALLARMTKLFLLQLFKLTSNLLREELQGIT
jgi:hypothetical protein